MCVAAADVAPCVRRAGHDRSLIARAQGFLLTADPQSQRPGFDAELLCLVGMLVRHRNDSALTKMEIEFTVTAAG